MIPNKRISIFTGHFGSGKTEVAVNFSLEIAKSCQKAAIIDFDIVNPYFRTADAKDALLQKGIWVLVPMYANTNVDVPALPPEINALFEKKDYRVVFDVGGDDVGAKVLSRYHEEIMNDEFEMYFVINTKRGMTDTPEKIEEMIQSIEYSSRLKVTKLVNNTNLLQCTSPKDIMEGYEVIKAVSERLHIPIAFTSGFIEPLNSLVGQVDTPLMYMHKLIKLPWD